jgi:hypothetical protein
VIRTVARFRMLRAARFCGKREPTGLSQEVSFVIQSGLFHAMRKVAALRTPAPHVQFKAAGFEQRPARLTFSQRARFDPSIQPACGN